jgi:hemerythrin
MPIVEWSKELSVSVAEIDRQHQRLIQMLNDLSNAMKQGKGAEILGKTIDRLIDYAKTHFAFEEKYFDQFGYPETASHKKVHLDFAKKVSDVKDRFAKGQVSISLEVMDFLSDWLKSHIMGLDKKYGPFFNEKGLK